MAGGDLEAKAEPMVRRSRLPHERRYTSQKLPRRLLTTRSAKSTLTVFDFTGAMQRLCEDIVTRCPTFRTLDLSRVLVTYTPCRNRSRYGLQARVTPMRFRNGALTTRRRGVLYGIQRFFLDDRELMYLMSFSLPRFLDQSFEEKLTTVFHELFHISPAFDGDIRRLPGRCEVHSHSKYEFDRQMLGLAHAYLADHPQPDVYEPFRFRTAELFDRYRGLSGVVVPQPKLIPLAW